MSGRTGRCASTPGARWPSSARRSRHSGPTRCSATRRAVGLLACDQLDGRLSIVPRIVATTSEVRTDETLERIRAAWGVEPFDVFGSTETLYGGDCAEHAGIHAFEDQCLVEVVEGRLSSRVSSGTRNR